MKKKLSYLSLGIMLVSLGFAGCSDDDDDSPGGGGSSTTAAFPTDFAVTSPLNSSTGASVATLDGVAASGPSSADFDYLTSQIDGILAGTVTVSTAFDPAMFFRLDNDASCFGPRLLWANHPDGGSPASGELPTGDLGLWLETDGSTGVACAAAELNARMAGVSGRSFMALVGLASLVSVADATGLAMPSVGGSIDLATGLNALGLASVSFTSASISQPASGTWAYALEMEIDDGGTARTVVVNLTHNQGATATEYEGLWLIRL